MLESFLQGTLTGLLSQIFDKLQPGALSLALSKGEISLKNLQLKQNLLPPWLGIDIAWSCIEEVSLKIPWAAFFSEKTIVSVRGVYLLVRLSAEVSSFITKAGFTGNFGAPAR